MSTRRVDLVRQLAVSSRLLGGRAAVAAAMVWGLAWIAIARSTDEPRSVGTVVVGQVGPAEKAGDTATSGRLDAADQHRQ